MTKNRNQLCSCGSGKKTKKCCKSVFMKHVPPNDDHQDVCRRMIKNMTDSIPEPHCRICGDTEADGELVAIQTNIESFNLCGECYKIQKNM